MTANRPAQRSYRCRRRCAHSDPRQAPPGRRRHAFSLIELLVVLAITSILIGLLFPSFAQLRENAHRVVCASNTRNIGIGISMYANEHHDRLPYSEYAKTGQPQEMMASHREEFNAWDGIGELWIRGYCTSIKCFHCPSHTNGHTVEEYGNDYLKEFNARQLLTNYHYKGHWDWVAERPNRLTDGDRIALITDGMRTLADYNHKTGMNVLRGDFSVIWHEDDDGEVRSRLPQTESPPGDSAVLEDTYAELWDIIVPGEG
jgi:prepilin-type N-terminal cleavage/methylation domain-containing protein